MNYSESRPFTPRPSLSFRAARLASSERSEHGLQLPPTARMAEHLSPGWEPRGQGTKYNRKAPSGATPTPNKFQALYRPSGAWTPLSAPHPGFRCAAPWAKLLRPPGVGLLPPGLDSGAPALKRHPGMTVRFEPGQPICVNLFIPVIPFILFIPNLFIRVYSCNSWTNPSC